MRNVILIVVLLFLVLLIVAQPIIYSPTLKVEVWVDKGCGATYFLGENIVIYFKANKDVMLTLVDDYQWGTKVLFNDKVKGNKVYVYYGKITFPSSYRRFYVYALDEEGRTAYDECMVNIASKEEKPDLVITGVSISPGVPVEGRTMSVRAQVVNLVPVTTGHFTVGFYIDDVLIGTARVKLLGSAPFTGIGVVWRVPIGFAGSHKLRIVADINDEIEEENEDNNIWVEDILILSSETSAITPWQPVKLKTEENLPDIVIGNVTFIPSEIKENSLTLILIEVFNRGGNESGAFNLTLCLDDREIGYKKVGNILGGLYTRVAFFWKVPKNVSGERQLKIVADKENIVVEADEDNNVKLITILIKEA